MHTLDATVEYTALRDEAPELVGIATPDWLVVLIAAARGYDGLVTRDLNMLDTPETVAALTLTTALSVVTWRKGVEDPVAEWGQLLAYMPLVIRHMGATGASIFVLPKPSLDAKTGAQKARGRAHEVALRHGTSFTEMLAQAKSTMRSELVRRQLTELAVLVES